MTQATEQIASQFANGAGNSRVWGDLIVNVKVFGAKGNGTTDDTAAISAALTSLTSGGTLRFPTGTYRISSALNVPSNVIVEGVGEGTVIKLSSGDMTGFLVSSKSGVVIRDLRITCDIAGTVTTGRGILINSSQKCIVENVSMDGLSWAGVMIYDANNNIVKNCRFYNWRGTLNDSADIYIYNNSNYNIIDGCYCFGLTSWFGIMIQDPYTAAKPTGNRIVNNQVGEHLAYGIAIYVTTQYNTQTLISGNKVRDIRGSGVNGTSGAGIYVQSAGGTIVTGNDVNNCCVDTTNFDTLGMGCISVTNILLGSSPVSVEGNNVYATRGPCVHVTTCDVSVNISGGSLVADSAEGPRGSVVYAVNAKSLMLNNITMEQKGATYDAVGIVANDKSIDNIQLANITIKTAALGVAFNVVATGSFINVMLSGVRVFGGDNQALFLQKVTAARIIGCDFSSTSFLAQINGCPSLRVTGTRFNSSYGSYSLLFTGACTGSVVDESNDILGNLHVQNDAGSGVLICQYGDSTPASGIWNVGDRIKRRTSVVGQPKGWQCTTAPNVWTSEGYL